MPKDRDQLTPDDREDRDRIHPRRSAAREAIDPLDPSTGRGPASRGGDPDAREEVGEPESEKYR
jgi:hypothetical protein